MKKIKNFASRKNESLMAQVSGWLANADNDITILTSTHMVDPVQGTGYIYHYTIIYKDTNGSRKD